jgi:hypothetical protein
MRTVRFSQFSNVTRQRITPNASFSKDENGSLTIFSLFLFVILLMTAGMAVDMVHQEQRRVAMQNAVDSGILAASSMSQQLDAETMVKDYVAKAGFDPSSVTVTPVDTYSGNGAGLTSREVAVRSDVSTDTMFMGLMGISSLSSPADGSAIESRENIEISLVLDISGSMNWASADASKSKLAALKEAAKEFVDVIFASNDPQRVSISIVAYNQQVYVPNELMSRLNVDNSLVSISNPAPYPGALTQYRANDVNAPCLIFDDADYQTLALGAGGAFDRSSAVLADNYYWEMNGQVQQYYQTPYEWARWCGNYYSKILPLSNDPVALKAHIDGLTASGATAINIGLNWGLALLDNSMGGIVNQMVASGELSADVAGRPFAYNAQGVQKYVVLMTDGENTNQLDLKQDFKSGPTRAWYSPSAAATSTHDGYYVLMPGNSAQQRWYRPRSPNTAADNEWVAEADLPADAYQLDYHELYQRFGYRSAAWFLFGNADTAALTAHDDALEDIGGWNTADTRLGQLCTQAKTNSRVKVFTVAFEAPAGGQSVLQNCAYAPGFYFDVDGTDIKSAFQSIAGQIALLRLKE